MTLIHLVKTFARTWVLTESKEGPEPNFSILCLAIPRLAKKFRGRKVKIASAIPKCAVSEIAIKLM